MTETFRIARNPDRDSTLPYVLWVHQRPCTADAPARWPRAHVHLHIAPLFRSAGVPRYVAAGELGSGVYYNPVSPEDAAEHVAGEALPLKGLVELQRRDDTLLHEELAELPLFSYSSYCHELCRRWSAFKSQSLRVRRELVRLQADAAVPDLEAGEDVGQVHAAADTA